ncbi:phosphopantetheine-binding protein [Amycolatopsis sp. PS_44_ISF1]|uniref:phosphopantetheine-binding protein n=1 Tax=Amycolatopsis sp. PS_44_ISF1 TaxID=2974917 RepID=UPI0028DE3BC8|nr:phosphopantetheine-binding protein [Amycolatopsis sp. PS_44_ISF1]MDT8912289.1 phosphopantetheine-binding protein [Amycolatopsis sp. PS_44_ISF1]
MSDDTMVDGTRDTLADFMRELLGIEEIGPGDLLLDLGGNSLIATMLANRVELAWDFRPTMVELMTSTFAELVALCTERRADRERP